jgi:hypothetical protein
VQSASAPACGAPPLSTAPYASYYIIEILSTFDNVSKQ